MAALTILHVSDLHMSRERRRDTLVVFEALVEDLRRWQSKGVRPDIICVTGDIAFSGKPDQYELAGRYIFDPLLQELSLDKEHLFWVPGNHDLDRDMVKDCEKRLTAFNAGLLRQLGTPAGCDRALEDEALRAVALQPMAAYSQFTRDYLGEQVRGQSPEFYTARSIEVNGVRVGVAGLNSAWRSRGTKDKGRLVIGDLQLRLAHQDVEREQPHVRIALAHHPFEWLHPEETDAAHDFSVRRFDLVLRGHIHEARPHMVISPQGEAILFTSRALAKDRSVEGYSLIQLDASPEIHLRRYIRNRDRFDYDVDAAEEGRFTFRLGANVRRLWTRHTNVPVLSTPLIGRETEQKQVQRMLEDGESCAVTLTGPAGVGKTRLAQHVARAFLEARTYGACLVDLSDMTDPSLLAPAIAQKLGVSSGGGRPVLDRVRNYLQDRRILLVLDNLGEELGRSSRTAEILATLASCRLLRLLVTCREALRLECELECPVRGLSLEDAVRLFRERALSVGRDFSASGNLLSEICRRLDGLPLAIELTAAQAADRTLEEILQGLQRQGL